MQEVKVNNILIGWVYKSSHRVWVAQPIDSKYSNSFLSEAQAVWELISYHYEQQGYSADIYHS